MATAAPLSPLQLLSAYGIKILLMAILQGILIIFRPDISTWEDGIIPVELSKIRDTYDFIIIGGGSAGSVLANRLSENENWQILLLEAGTNQPPLADVPLTFALYQNTPIDWQYRTEPSGNYCLALRHHQSAWPRGKVLGGSSVLNAMLYVRANREDYDNWERMGNPGWSYNDVLPYFMKSQDNRIPKLNPNYHSSGGYLTVENFKYTLPITSHILRAGQDLGYQEVDVNGAQQTGFTYTPGTLRDGLRCSTAKAFLQPAAGRSNLHISVHSVVQKILIDEISKTAYGVEFKAGPLTYVVKARREVILSAGAIKSPQLLSVSGVGPKQHLEQLGIRVIHNLPGVGENLQDHVGVGGMVIVVDRPPEGPVKGLLSALPILPSLTSASSAFTFTIQELSLKALVDFIVKRDGILYSSTYAAMLSFINTKYENPARDYPDIEVIWASGSEASDVGVSASAFNVAPDVYNSMFKDLLLQNTFEALPLLMRPRSRGYVRLRSKDPSTDPIIVPNYFEDPHDLEVLIEGAKFVSRIINTPTMKNLNARLNPNKMPGCEHYDYSTDNYWRCHARHYSATNFHPSCTCKMGPASDKMAVVDHRLRVHGIKNLRVVDTSIMPHITSGNTNAPTIMIAEKASDMIKQDWGYHPSPKKETSDKGIIGGLLNNLI
ncbi:glucose dehydrogenase [FAD, quinone]-like [Calliopsis andreniformis]|uniref:glucose dehydrogenase [FAD, quinone]-like n=1 Tax=Calliopsis andreniformis TaxID=337506 RepID=UPI003FCE9715